MLLTIMIMIMMVMMMLMFITDDNYDNYDNYDNDDDDDQTNLCLEEQWHMEDCYIASPGRHCPGIAEPTPPDYEHHENQTINDLLDK